MKSVTITWNNIEKLRKRNKILLIVWICVFLLAAAMIFVFRVAWAGMVISLVNLITYILYVRRELLRYSEEVALATVRHGLCRSLDHVVCQGKDGLSREIFESWNMLPLYEGKNSLMSRHSFSGTGYGMKLAGSEVTFHYPANRKEGKEKFCFLSGALLTGEKTAEHEGDWLILQKGLLEETAKTAFLKQRGYQASDSPDLLREHFEIYQMEESGEFPGDMAERIENLRKKCRNIGAVRLNAAGAAVYLNRCFFVGNTYPKVTPTEELLERNYFPERDEVWKLFRNW